MSHWRVYGIEHIDEIREEPKEQRDAVSEARGPYNTVASRIRNLLLIIMLSILTRRSYLASLSLSSLSSSPSFSLDPDASFLSLWLFVVLRPSRAVSLDAALYGNRGRYRFTTVPSR